MPTDTDPNPERGHESLDHEHPSSAGLMECGGPEAEVPGTGVMGDETLVRDADGEGVPGLYPGMPAHTGGEAHAGPGTTADEA